MLVLRRDGLHGFGRRVPCTIGRGGVTHNKREGDGATPIGEMRIIDMLYRADRMARPTSWSRPIGTRDLWSDDPRDPAYNQQVRAPHIFRHEKLKRSDRLYDLILVTDWNMRPAQPGRGSAIFLHRWRRHVYPTEGCIAMAPQDLIWLASKIARNEKLCVCSSGRRQRPRNAQSL